MATNQKRPSTTISAVIKIIALFSLMMNSLKLARGFNLQNAKLSIQRTAPVLEKRVSTIMACPHQHRRNLSRSVLFLAAGVAITSQRNFTAAALCEDDSEDASRFPDDALTLDSYNGITLRAELLASAQQDGALFASTFQRSLASWKEEGKRGVWIQVPTSLAHLVPICVEQGFEFHFARNGVLTLTQWLPDTPSRLPLGPTHQVGVGCFVVHPSDPTKMLCVQEKTGPAAQFKLWKMPTGLLDPGEDIGEAAVRELREETSLDGELDSILVFRQSHPRSGQVGQSDLFFVCRMKVATEDLSVAQVQEEEIAEMRWMSMEEYANQEVWRGSPLYMEINRAMMDTKNAGLAEIRLPVGFRPGEQTIYMPSSGSNL